MGKGQGKQTNCQAQVPGKGNRQRHQGGGSRSDSVRPDRNPRNKFSADQRLVESADMKRSNLGGANDPGWYGDSVDLLSAYFSYPFAAPLGRNFESGLPGLDQYSVPGIMALYFAPTVGVATSPNDAVNVAAQRIYSYVRHANSGHANYDSTDLQIYLLAMDSLEIYAEYLKRLYGVMLSYAKTNWYVPEALIQAMGVNPSDLQQHIPDLLGYIKVFIAKLSALAVPGELSYNKRHAWLCRNLWLDSDASSKSQIYLYVPEKLYKFQLDSAEGNPGMLAMVDIGTKPNRGAIRAADLLTFQDLVTQGNNLLDAVVSQEDFGIMSGDIMKAFPNSYRTITDITSDYSVPFQYSEEVLSQIENATIFAGVIQTSITQSFATPGDRTSAWLASTPSVYVDTFIPTTAERVNVPDAINSIIQSTFASVYDSRYRTILNFHHDNVKESEVAVATRLMTKIDVSKNIVYQVSTRGSVVAGGFVDACGSEILSGGIIFSMVRPTGTVARQLYAFDVNSYLPLALQSANPGAAGGVMVAANRASQLATFDWHPAVQMAYLEYNFSTATVPALAITASGAPQGMLLDADNFTWIDSANLANMHEAALLNELWYKTGG